MDSYYDSYYDSYHESETEIAIILDEIIQRVSVDTDPEIPDTIIPDVSMSIDKTDTSHMRPYEDNNMIICIICLDDTNVCVKNIKDLKHIDKICDCYYDVHIKCFHRWIQTTPVCPYCHELILIKNRTTSGQYQQLRTINYSNNLQCKKNVMGPQKYDFLIR